MAMSAHGGNTGGDNALLHVGSVWEAEVLCRGYVTQKIRSTGRSDGAADGGSDVIVAGENIGDQRT